MALPSTYVVRVYVAAWRGRRAIVGIVEDTAGAARPFRSADELWALVADSRLPRFGPRRPRLPRRNR